MRGEALERIDRVDRGELHVRAGPRVGEDAAVEDDEDEDLGDERHAEDHRRDPNVEIREQRDPRHHREG